jgi:Thioredoxin like C-terminal domain
MDSTGRVLAPTKDGKPVRFKVTRDGAVLGDDHGADSAPDGTGEVRDPRLYQLIWLERQVQDRTLRSNSLIPAFRVFRSRLVRRYQSQYAIR